MDKRFVIVSAGPAAPELAAAVHPEDFIIACDAGWKNCEKLGLAPRLVIGDFDSAPRPDGVKTIVLPHEKDDTDTHYAARWAAEQGARKVLLLGALGGARLEHTLANLGTALWLEKQGIRAELLDARSRITFAAPGHPRRYRRGAYFYLSLLPAGGPARGVCASGVRYPLQDACLQADFPLGVSNEFCADEAEISLREGFLAVIETKADF